MLLSLTFSALMMRIVTCAFVLSSVLLSGCSSTNNSQASLSDPKDPLESINRPIWTLSWDYADKYVLKPTSQAYVNNVNSEVRTGLYNIALNLNEPSAVVNSLLQGEFSDAAKSTGRFLLNSTIGLFGIFDPASDFEWTRKHEEFGEVLGKYGVGDGAYLVVPGLGPSSIREEVGDYVDKYYWPLAIIDFWPNLLRIGVIGLEQRAALAEQEQLITDSFDSYEFVKNAYFQNMRYKVYDGNPPIEVNENADDELEAYMDEFDEDEID